MGRDALSLSVAGNNDGDRPLAKRDFLLPRPVVCQSEPARWVRKNRDWTGEDRDLACFKGRSCEEK